MGGYWPALASLRDNTIWPSRIERTSSAIGSLSSSPSVSTEYAAVIDPCTPVPARSSSCGSIENTEGG